MKPKRALCLTLAKQPPPPPGMWAASLAVVLTTHTAGTWMVHVTLVNVVVSFGWVDEK